MACAAGAMAASGHLRASVAKTLVILQGLFDGERRLALALEVVWVVFLRYVNKVLTRKNSRGTYHTRPSAVITSRLSLQVSSLFIIENPSETISHPRWDNSNTLQRTMPLHSIDDVLPWGSPQGLFVRVLDRRERTVFGIPIASETGGIVRALVVVPTEACFVQTIDDVGALEVLFPKMRSTVSNFLIMTQLVKRSV
jgi:hypothetical protein